MSADVCKAPACAGSVKVRCSRCSRELCTWHHVLAIGDGAELAPVCFPTCGAEYWSGPGVPEVRPHLVLR